MILFVAFLFRKICLHRLSVDVVGTWLHGESGVLYPCAFVGDVMFMGMLPRY